VGIGATKKGSSSLHKRTNSGGANFAHGNTVIENPRVTREMIDEAADELDKAKTRLHKA
jgi:hypothetical protein